jgi:hypothetical protein
MVANTSPVKVNIDGDRHIVTCHLYYHCHEKRIDLTYTDNSFESILGVSDICEEADIQHVAPCVLGTWHLFAKCIDKFRIDSCSFT